jgi:CDGSH-type Zn-finger protein
MNTILATENGPLECNGEFELMAADGTYLAHETQTWLCRCGRSQAKPYCDGSHKTTGFSDAATPPQAPDDGVTQPPGPVRIVLRANGPLKLDGPCAVLHPTAGVLFTGNQTALCRCGHSNKKPFCDGTHRQVEFVA